MPSEQPSEPISRQLAQVAAPAVAATLLSPTGASSTLVVDKLIVCNFTATDSWVSIFHDEDGTTFDSTTALLFQFVLPGRSSIDITDVTGPIILSNSNGALGHAARAATDLTVTAYGREVVVHDGL